MSGADAGEPRAEGAEGEAGAPAPASGEATGAASAVPAPSAHANGHGHGDANVRTLALAALGVVFGDIGTSPLYALKECVHGPHGVAPTPANVLGLLSLIFWSVTMVVTVKYLTFIMRADNHGEGGILALLALLPPGARGGASRARVGWVAAMVVFGAALLYGDGIITPAISVLSAMEGLGVATTRLQPAVVPLTCAVLVGLFAIQKRGTAGIGKLFGPVMVVWFATLAVLGVVYIAKNPSVLVALSPLYAVRFFMDHGVHGMVVLGSVVLAITGGEALYADMGHFGRRAIQLAWYGAAMPALLLNYFGQGALLLQEPSAAANPFFAFVPAGSVFTYVLVALATAATVIASQALISGAFSLTQQAVQLGFLPRVTITHTSSETKGQIYIPEVNWALAISCIALVLAFRESTRLAAAYGIAVTGTMGITSIVYFLVLVRAWKWPLYKALPLVAFFLAWDLAFFGANMLKFFDGGYVPIVVGAAIFTAMVTWKRGRGFLAEAVRAAARPIEAFVDEIVQRSTVRVPGTAVFLWSNREGLPPILGHHVRHNKALHETVLIVTVTTEHVPKVARADRVEVEDLGRGFWRVVARSGFMESPDVPALIAQARDEHRVPIDLDDITYYVGRETFLATDRGKMGRWSEALFSLMSRNARPASRYFCIPPERVVELGMQLDL